MGIGAALVGGGLGLIGNAIAGSSQKKAAETQADAASNAAQAQIEAAQIAADQQQAMFDQGLALSQPYIDAGRQALGGLQSLSTPGGQQQALNQYTGSDLFQGQLASGSENVLRNAAATGALRTGQSDFALGSLPIAMQQQYLNSQRQQLQGLAGMGAQASGQGFSGFQNLGSNLANTTVQGAQQAGAYNTQAGAYNAQAGAAMPNAIAGGLSDLGGLGLYGAMGGFDRRLP